MKTEKESLISNIEQDYKKLSNECKKKYNTIREVIEISLKAFEKLKAITSNESTISSFNTELSLSIEILLKPVILITESKHVKLFPLCAIILQKLITYSFITTKVSNTVIIMLKDIFDNTLEDTHFKVLNSLLSMINSNSIDIEEETINNVMIMSCKIFSFKNSEFKNPIRSLFKTLIEKIFDSISYNEEQLKTTKKFTCAVSLIKSLIDISDGKKKEWIAPTIYSKCLGLELLSSLIISQRNTKNFETIEEFAMLIRNDLCKCIVKAFTTTNDYFIGVKLARLSLIIVKQLYLDKDVLQNIFRYAEREGLVWQKLIGLESLNAIFQEHSLVVNIYKNNFQLYEELLKTLTDITYKNIVKKCNESPIKKKEEKTKGIVYDPHFLSKTKAIENSSIIIEGESIPINLSNSYMYKLLTDCYVNLRDSFIYIMEEKGLLINQINSALSSEQNEIKDMLNFQYVTIKGALVALLLNSTDDGVTQTYLNLFQSFISIYASISLPNIRDEYLDALCKLAIPNNLENSPEMKEKNILIARTIFNIAHCVNLLDYSSWILLLETMQNLYLMLINSNNYIIKPGGEGFDIEIVIKNLEMNIRKYSYDTPCSEIKEMVKENELIANMKESSHIIINQQVSPSGIIVKKKANNNNSSSNSQQNDKKRQMTSEERDNMIILSTAIDTLLIDSNSYDKSTVENIAKALYKTTKKIVDCIGGGSNVVQGSNNNNNDTTAFIYLHFNLTKILDLCMINYARIDIIWEIITQTIHLISSKNLEHISKFSLEIISEIIVFIISKYQPLVKKEDMPSERWNKKNWQKTIMTPYLLMCSNINNNLNNTPNTNASITALNQQTQDINFYLITNLVKFIERCGIALNSIGWSFLIEICSMILNKSDLTQSENNFKLIEQIFNEYSSYLTIYNILPLVSILADFSIFKLNSNICYSAIALYWSCATITENFQRAKVVLTQSQNDIFIDDMPDKATQDAFFSDLWKTLFNTLLLIYSDNRFEVRKSGITIFAEIFVAKIGNITEEVALVIIRKNFLEIIERNNNTFEAKRENSALQHNEEKEWEETIVISLQATGKAIKAFLSDKNYSNQKISIVTELMNKCLRIIKLATPEIGMQILKVINEIQGIDQDVINDPLFIEIYWKIYEEFGKYLSNDYFIKRFSTTNLGSKLFNCILDNLRSVFIKNNMTTNTISNSNNSSYNNSNKLSKESLQFLLPFISQLLNCAKHTEGNTININPQKVLKDEKEVFDFIDEILKSSPSKENLTILYKFLSNFITYDELIPHTEAYCRRSLESIQILFDQNDFEHSIHISNIIEKCKTLILLRGQKSSVMKIFECNKTQLFFWQYVSSELIKLLQSIISKLSDANSFEIIIACFEEIFKQSEGGYKAIPSNLQEDLAKSCQEMDIQIINFIVNDLIPNAFYISSHLQAKLLILLDMGSNIDYASINSYFSIRKMCIANLFDLCMYKTEDEIKMEKKSLVNAKHIDDFVKIKIKIAKMCTPILIKRCRCIIRKYLEDEVKSGAMPLARARLEEIKFVLEKLKNLDVYPDFNNIEEDNMNMNCKENEEGNNNNDLMKVVIKTKKAHLFLLHSLLSDFIISKENDIKMIIRDIFKCISILMGISETSYA